MREALKAIEQGHAELAEYHLVSQFFRAAADLLATGAVQGEPAEEIKTLKGRHLMKHNVIPWEREHGAQVGMSAAQSEELNQRFLRAFDLT